MKNREKIKAIMGLFFTVCAFLLLLITKEEISDSICKAIIFCGRVVIPKLFLSICFSRIVWEIGIIERFISAYPKYGAEISAFVMGIIAGFPTGGIICSMLVDGGYITEKRGEYITAFSNNAGIAFVFGYVSQITGREGAISVFVCQIIVSLLIAVIFRGGLSEEDKREIYFKVKEPSLLGIPRAISKSVENIIGICGFILFFSAFTGGVLADMPLILKGFTELTTGIGETASLPFESRLVYCGAFIGFCGVCVHFQIACASGVKMGKYFFAKCLSAVLFAVMVLPIHCLVTRFL